MAEPISLCVASVCYGGFASAGCMRSLLALRAACDREGVPLKFELWGGEALIGRARAGMLAKFLAGEASHLLFVDSEAAFEPADVFALLASPDAVAATPDERLFLIARAAGEAVAAAHPELHGRLGDIRGGGGAPVPLVFETILRGGRTLDDLAAFHDRWRSLAAGPAGAT